MLRTRHRMQGRGGEGVVSGLASVRDRDVCGYATAAIRQAAGQAEHTESSCNWQLALLPHATSSGINSGSPHQPTCIDAQMRYIDIMLYT